MHRHPSERKSEEDYNPFVYDGDQDTKFTEEEYLKELDAQINFLRIKSTYKFFQAIDHLRTQLETDIQQQQAKRASPEAIKRSDAYKILQHTTFMLQTINGFDPCQVHLPEREHRLNTLREYKNNCRLATTSQTFLKAVAVVFFAGCGLLVGAGIGFSIGVALGFCTGPAALVPAVGGMATGAISGAGICLTTGAAITGLGSGALSSFLLFKPKPLTRCVNEVIKQAEASLSKEKRF